MAWPSDARYVNYTEKKVVKSAELNEFQDQIYANHASIEDLETDVTSLSAIKYKWFRCATPDGTNAYVYTATDAGYWLAPAGVTGIYLNFPCPLNHSSYISEIKAKVYNGDSSAHNWTLTANLVDFNAHAGDLTAAPTIAAQGTSGAVSVGATSYAVLTYTPASAFRIDADDNADHGLVINVGPNYHNDDKILGVRICYTPIA